MFFIHAFSQQSEASSLQWLFTARWPSPTHSGIPLFLRNSTIAKIGAWGFCYGLWLSFLGPFLIKWMRFWKSNVLSHLYCTHTQISLSSPAVTSTSQASMASSPFPSPLEWTVYSFSFVIWRFCHCARHCLLGRIVQGP